MSKGRSAVISRGIEISSEHAFSLIEPPAQPDLMWLVKIAFPFDWAASKNHLFAMRREGHVALRAEGRKYRSVLSLKIKAAMRGQHVVQNKVWIDIFIQKPNQRGDAVNFVDLICDAVKEAIGVDDRWFSIRRLDWQIVKSEPSIFIGIGQETDEEAQACASCGQIVPIRDFHKNANARLGISRNCKDCTCARRGRVRA